METWERGRPARSRRVAERASATAPVSGPAARASRVLFCRAALLAILTALPAGATTVVLRDGSAITGEVVSLKDGVYTIRSRTLGTLAVKQSDVRILTEDGAVRTRTDDPGTRAAGELEALQSQLAADPATVDALTALKDDPAVAAMLQDPQVLRALQSGNLDALLSNPNVARLAADPRIQDITKKFAH